MDNKSELDTLGGDVLNIVVDLVILSAMGFLSMMVVTNMSHSFMPSLHEVCASLPLCPPSTRLYRSGCCIEE